MFFEKNICETQKTGTLVAHSRVMTAQKSVPESTLFSG
jgi:hypothetical protein